MSVDWDARWAEHQKEFCLGFAMICNACGGGSISNCACAKKRWINREKEKLGLPVEKPYKCEFCGNQVIFVRKRIEDGRAKDICDGCL